MSLFRLIIFSAIATSILSGCLGSSPDGNTGGATVIAGPILGGEVRGDFYQGGDEILTKLRLIRRRFSQTVTKLSEHPGLYPVCEYFGCAEGMDPVLCEMMEEISEVDSYRQACQDFIEAALPEWKRVVEDETNIPIQLWDSSQEVDEGMLTAKTSLATTGPIYFHWLKIQALLNQSQMSAAMVLIHEMSHKILVEGEFLSDENGGRDEIDHAAIAVAYLTRMSLDRQAYLLKREYDISTNVSLYFNFHGAQEKYVKYEGERSAFILPDGSVYGFYASLAQSPFLEKLNPMYYAHPELLSEAPLPTWAASEDEILIELVKTLDGRFQLRAGREDYYYNLKGLEEKWLHRAGTSNWILYILPTGQMYWYSTETKESLPYALLSPRYWEDPSLIHEAIAD